MRHEPGVDRADDRAVPYVRLQEPERMTVLDPELPTVAVE
jgi:hypothetical protein